jgi:hypothetical protein
MVGNRRYDDDLPAEDYRRERKEKIKNNNKIGLFVDDVNPSDTQQERGFRIEVKPTCVVFFRRRRRVILCLSKHIYNIRAHTRVLLHRGRIHTNTYLHLNECVHNTRTANVI